MYETIPVQGPQDCWPRTKDGYLAVPGMHVAHSNSIDVVRKVYDGGEYGFCVEIENVDGPQGWVPLHKCTFVLYP